MSNTLISKMDKNILTNVEGPVFVNYKDPSKPVLKSMLFYGYYIRYFDFEYGQMFVVSDLLTQYCKNNNKKRYRFVDFLKIDSTQKIIDVLCENINDVKSRHLNNSDVSINNLNVKGIIEINEDIKDYGINIKTKTYIICEKLLNLCLIWIDPVFAVQVSSFLEACRKQYYEQLVTKYQCNIKYLTDKTELLSNDNKSLITANQQLTVLYNTTLNRSVKNISKESFCSYIYVRGFVYDEFKTSVIISHGFRNQLQLPANIRKTALVLINNMPSGHQYRNQIKSKMLDVLGDYDGEEYIANDNAMTLVLKNKSDTYVNTFAIQAEKYTDSMMIILDIDGKYKGKHPSFDFKISIPNNELVLDFIDMSNSLIIDNHWNESYIKNYNDLN